MDRLIIQDVRCFAGRHELPVRPLTLLVGENSSGKSTFLALMRTAASIVQRGLATPDFNEEPFLLGAYEQIARRSAGGQAIVEEFGVGFRESRRRGKTNVELEVFARFREDAGQPQLCDITASAGDVRATLTAKARQWQGTITDAGGTAHAVADGGLAVMQTADMPLWFAVLPFLASPDKNADLAKAKAESFRPLTDPLMQLAGARYRAIAPIRSRPRRTYDPRRDDPTPEGDHVPMLLARLASTDDANWPRIRAHLQSFGAPSGLLDGLDVQRKGDKKSDPFQVVVNISGMQANLIDVGYGVSQVLPVLVDTALAPEGTTFLLQQPEVHLHPRAQAQLGTFLARLAKTEKKHFVVETHSDYLVDRVCMEVRDKNIAARDVIVLYFERSEAGVHVHPIQIDSAGNLEGAPASYRDFFLAEQRRYLGAAPPAARGGRYSWRSWSCPRRWDR